MRWRAWTYLLVAVSVACDRATAPVPGERGVLKITIATDGVDAPTLVVTLDGTIVRTILPTDSVILRDVSPGRHRVALTQVTPNCSVHGLNPIELDVASGSTSLAAFSLTCVSVTGVIAITTNTTGLDGPTGWQVRVDAQQPLSMPSIGSLNMPFQLGGDHTVELRDVPPNCTIADGTNRAVNVKTGGTTRDTVRVEFSSTCTTVTGVIALTLNASGVDFGDVFSVTIGSLVQRALTPNTTTLVSVSVGEYLVKLAPMPANCSLSGADASTLVVASTVTVRDTARVTFEATCTRSDLIAFERDFGIMLVRSDGSGAMKISDGGQPSWAPDRGRIVFTRSYCDYYCYDLGLSIVDFRSGSALVTPLTNQSDYSPAWSPDGSVIAFGRQGSLWRVKPDGTSAARIPLTVSVTSRVAWSPDGLRLAFGCYVGSEYEDICVVNADGSGFARLTSQGQRNFQPAWSPDGKTIAFVRTEFSLTRDDNPQPYVALMKPDGTGVTRLADGTDPAWSPDGGTIVFSSPAPAGLAKIKPDGTGRVQLTSNASDVNPAWRP